MAHSVESPAEANGEASGVNVAATRRNSSPISEPDDDYKARRRRRNRARLLAWSRILHAVAEQREALDCRIWREDPEDTLLAADCQTFCELVRALSYFLKAKSA